MSSSREPVDATQDVERHLTAIGRAELSRPVARAMDDGLLPPESSFFDYGCGRGGDLQRLAALGYDVAGWDPVHLPEGERTEADVVNLGYVVNVIESPSERAETLQKAWALAKGVLIVAARTDWDGRSLVGQRYGDGILTSKGTFQKFYTQEELRDWIDTVLGVRSVTGAPGIFYVFRDDTSAQRLLAARVRSRPAVARRTGISEALYETNRDILDPLIAFIEARGRPPEAFELPEAGAIGVRFGSVKAALAVVRRVTGDEAWQAAGDAARNDLTVYLALAAFGGRPKFTALPPDLQIDVKSFFGSYKEACVIADNLLFKAGDQAAIDRACREATIGKLTHEALYIHVSALPTLTPLLRVYEGCGRALTGTVEGTTIVKLNRIEPKVSYLAYPDFDSDPHPALAISMRAHLRRLHVKFRDFRQSSNPPVLHRKETFVAPGYAGRDRFAQLTAQEERLGLFTDAASIGTRNQWTALLESKGLRFEGDMIVADGESHDNRSDSKH